jgi:hypothetical protein
MLVPKSAFQNAQKTTTKRNKKERYYKAALSIYFTRDQGRVGIRSNPNIFFIKCLSMNIDTIDTPSRKWDRLPLPAIARVFSFVCKVILSSLALKRDLDGLGTEKKRDQNNSFPVRSENDVVHEHHHQLISSFIKKKKGNENQTTDGKGI